MPEPSSFEKLRQVGHLEKYSTARHSLDFYNNVAVSASYSTPTPSSSLRSVIYRALAAVVATHPVLSAIPVDEDKPHPYFVRLPKIAFNDAVFFVTRKQVIGRSEGGKDTELDELLERQHNINFKERYGELPFWRLAILNESGSNSCFIACFIYHHALADGKSGLAFHRSFLSALQASSKDMAVKSTLQQSEPHPIISSSEEPLIPSLESLHLLPLSLPYLLKAQWNDWFPNIPQGLWTASSIARSSLVQSTCFCSLHVSAGTTLQLIKASRANSTTLTGTIEMLLVAALFSHLDADQFSTLRCQGAISLRQFLSPEVVDEDSMGTWVSRYVEEHHRSSTSQNARDYFSWTEARRVRDTIEAELSKKGRNNVVGLLRWVGDYHKFFIKKQRKRREESFELSNVGVFRPINHEGHEGEDWKVGRVVFSQSADVVGAAFKVSLASGGDDCLNLGISWLEGLVATEWVNRVIQSLKGLIEDVTREG